MTTSPKKILVTGATGYVGQHLTLSLCERGHRVYALTRNESSVFSGNAHVQPIVGNITDNVQFPSDIDTIYHCAGVIRATPDEMRHVNEQGTQQMINLALKNHCKLIYLSSAGIVGTTPEKIITENTLCQPHNDYESSKLRAEQLVTNAIRTQGLKAQILRPVIIFGKNKNNPTSDSFFQLIKSMRTELYKNIGHGIYNIVHIDEVIKALELLDQEGIPNGNTYIISNHISYKELDFLVKTIPPVITKQQQTIPYLIAWLAALILTVICKIMNKKNPLTFSRLFALTDERIYSQQKLERDLSFKNTKSVEEYLQETVTDYIAKNLIT